MNSAAVAVVKELGDITIAYGISDEYRLDLYIEHALPPKAFTMLSQWKLRF